MLNVEIETLDDQELRELIDEILKNPSSLKLTQNATPVSVILSLYEVKKDVAQKKRIQTAIHEILVNDFVLKTHDELDGDADQLLSMLANICGSLNVSKSYPVLRSLVDKGTFAPGGSFFQSKQTEKSILEALVIVQPPKLLAEVVWETYWDSNDPYFWDIALRGLANADLSLALLKVPSGFRRWREYPEFDFPRGLMEIINNIKDMKTKIELRKSMKDVSPSLVQQMMKHLKSMPATSETMEVLALWTEPIYSLGRIEVNRMNPFYIYYHRDLDGIACAVTFMLYLTKRYGHKTANMKTIPVDFDEKHRWEEFHIEQPSAILDFLFHPRANIYYDHHQKPFINNEFERSYASRIGDPYILLEKGESSATKLLFNDIKDLFELEFPDNFAMIQEMVNQVDRIDSAQYVDVDEWYSGSLQCIRLNRILLNNLNEDFCNKLVQDLIHSDIDRLLDTDEYKRLLAEADLKQKEEASIIEGILQPHGNVVLYDAVKPIPVQYRRFLPYKFHRNANFTVAVYDKRGTFEVSVGKNPWNSPDFEINVGELCMGFGGGGHKNVGGITFSNYNEALVTARRIVKVLQLPGNGQE